MSVVLAGSPIAPAWAVLPLAFIATLVTAAHLISLHTADARRDMPASRRRIRSANGVATLIAIPVLASAFGVVTQDEPRGFTLVWSAGAGLLGIVILLAAVDLVNTARLSARTRAMRLRDIRARRVTLEARVRELIRDARAAEDHDGR